MEALRLRLYDSHGLQWFCYSALEDQLGHSWSGTDAFGGMVLSLVLDSICGVAFYSTLLPVSRRRLPYLFGAPRFPSFGVKFDESVELNLSCR